MGKGGRDSPTRNQLPEKLAGGSSEEQNLAAEPGHRDDGKKDSWRRLLTAV